MINIASFFFPCFIRGKALLGHSDAELSSLGGYDLVHYDDLAYVASAHQERKDLLSDERGVNGDD